MTSTERLDRIEALQRQLDELKSFMLSSQQRVADVLSSGPPVSPMIAELYTQRSVENGHSGSNDCLNGGHHA